MPQPIAMRFRGDYDPTTPYQEGDVYLLDDKAYVCVREVSSGRIVGQAREFASSEAGPPGPQGPAGTDGATGPQGPEGPPGTTDHGALSGLTDDDHTQYPLLVGRATGQALVGGTGAAETLDLRGSSDAGLGTVRLLSPVSVETAAPEVVLKETDDTNRVARWVRNSRITQLLSDQVMTSGNYAVDFDGTDDYAVMASADLSMSGNAMSVEAWIYVDAFSGSVAQGQGIWSTTTNIRNFCLRLGTAGSVAANNKLQFYYGTGATWNVGPTSTTAISPGVWTHVCATFDGTNVRYYINGTLDASTPSNLAGTISWVSSTHCVGADYPAGTNRVFNGKIEEVAVWNKTLSAVEVAARYNSGSGAQLIGTETNLVYGYHFNEGTGTSAASMVAGKPAMTLTNGPTWVTGKFFGSTDTYGAYITIQDSTKNDISGELVLGNSTAYVRISSSLASLKGDNGLTLSGGDTGKINTRGRVMFGNDIASLDGTSEIPQIFGTSTGGAAYPFNQAGHLVIAPRVATFARDIVFIAWSGSGTTYNYPAIMASDGKLYLSGQAGEKDTNLYRSAADTLKTDDAFLSVGNITTNARLTSTTSASSAQALLLSVTGEGYGRFLQTSDGVMNWGDGTSARDTNLYRSAANVLRTDDSFLVNLNLTVNGNTTLGNASTDLITCTGRLILRTVASDPTANATAGTLNEIVVYNGKVYLKITGTGTDTNWVALN